MTFWQLTVPTSPEISDGLTNFLWEQGALGVVEEESPSEPPRLRAFFPHTASSTELLRAIRAYRDSLACLGFRVTGAALEISPLHDGEWASAWQRSFPPLLVGKRLLIVPPWEARDDATAGARVQVIIEPGRAFGTGHHGSTEGCLVLLEAALDALGGAPARALDIGTGTGILAISAVKLGVGEVLAVDIDPDAIAAARRNAETNDCADRVRLELEGPQAVWSTPPFRLVLANLLAHTHLALLPHYARLTAPGGSLVLGGILGEEAEQVNDALESAGFEPSARVIIDGWASLRLASPHP
jgi:ribosomal protein L11 methyltransferase